MQWHLDTKSASVGFTSRRWFSILCVSVSLDQTLTWHVCNDPWICPLCSVVSSSGPRRTSMTPHFTKLRFTLSLQIKTNCPLRPSSPHQGKTRPLQQSPCLHDVWPNYSLTHLLLWQKDGKDTRSSQAAWRWLLLCIFVSHQWMDVLLNVLFCQACRVLHCLLLRQAHKRRAIFLHFLSKWCLVFNVCLFVLFPSVWIFQTLEIWRQRSEIPRGEDS